MLRALRGFIAGPGSEPRGRAIPSTSREPTADAAPTAGVGEYDAFISFRHEDARKAARSLRLALQRWRIPADVHAAVRHPLRVYVDTFEGRATEDYWTNNIEPALLRSRFLIVLISPAASRALPGGGDNWVTREIDAFLATPQGRCIIPVFTRDCHTKILPAAIAARFPRIQTFDLGSRDRSMPLMPFLERPGKLEFIRIVAAVRRIADTDYPKLFREEWRRRANLYGWVGAAAIAVALTIAAGGTLALVNGIAAARASATADLHAALERLTAEPDVSALFAARGLSTVTGSILFKPFLQHEERRIRTLLGSIALPQSTVRWPGGRVGRMVLSPAGDRIAVWTENARLTVYDARTMAVEAAVHIPEIGVDAALVFADGSLVVSGENGERPRLALVDRSGKATLLPPVAEGSRQILLSDGRVLLGAPTGALEILDPRSGATKPMGFIDADRLEEAVLLPAAARIVVHASMQGPGSYKQYVFDAGGGGQVGDAAVTYQMSPLPSVSERARTLYRGTRDGAIERVDVASGARSEPIPATGQRADGVVASSDGELVAVQRAASAGVEIWDVPGMSLVVPPLGSGAPSGSAVIDASGRRVAVLTDAGVSVVDRGKPGEVLRIALDQPAQAAAFLRDGRALAVADHAGRVSIWDTSDGTPLVQGIRHRERFVTLSGLPDGRLASGGWDGSVRTTSVAAPMQAAWTPEASLAVPGTITAVAVHPSASLVALTTGLEVAACEIGGERCTWRRNLIRRARAIDFADRGRIVFTALDDGFVAHDTLTGSEIGGEPRGMAGADATGARAAVALSGGPFRVVWLRAGGGTVCESPVRFDTPRLVRFTAEGRWVAVVSSAQQGPERLTLLDARSCALAWSLDVPNGPVQTLAGSERLDVIAVGGAKGGAFYDLGSGSARGASIEERNLVNSIILHPTLPQAIVLGASGRITGLDITRPAQSFTPLDGGSDPWSAAYDRLGDSFAVGWITADKDQRFAATLHDAAFGLRTAPPFLHPADVLSVAITGDGRYLVTSCTDGTIRAWRLTSEDRTAAEVVEAIAETTGETIDLDSGAVRIAPH